VPVRGDHSREVKAALADGATDMKEVKRMTRMGMGTVRAECADRLCRRLSRGEGALSRPHRLSESKTACKAHSARAFSQDTGKCKPERRKDLSTES